MTDKKAYPEFFDIYRQVSEELSESNENGIYLVSVGKYQESIDGYFTVASNKLGFNVTVKSPVPDTEISIDLCLHERNDKPSDDTTSDSRKILYRDTANALCDIAMILLRKGAKESELQPEKVIHKLRKTSE